MRDACVAGIDLGTSGVKVALVGDDGAILAVATEDYPVNSVRAGWAESDPSAWESATATALARCLSIAPHARIAAVGIDGQMHSTLLVDADGRPRRPAILWPDSRATDIAGAFQRLLPSDLRASLANPITPGMPASVLAWLARNEPQLAHEGTRLLGAKDWVRGRLTGDQALTDPSDASATLLWDVPAAQWSSEMLAHTGWPVGILPRVERSDAVAGHTNGVGLSSVLPTGIPVAVGAADVAASLAALDANAHSLALIVGTGAQAIAPDVVPASNAAPHHHTFQSWDGTNYAMAAVTNAGLALARVVEMTGASWAELYGSLDTAPTATTVPVFLPFFTGERFQAGADAGSATFAGLDLSTTRTDLLRSALEGVAFMIAAALQSVPVRDVPAIEVIGGGAMDPRFLQLLSDVVGLPMRPILERHLTAVGAARLGARAANLTGVAAPVSRGPIIEPRDRGDLTSRQGRWREALDARAR